MEALKALARQRNDTSRGQLVAHLTDYIVARAAAGEHANPDMFGEIVCQVLDEVGLKTRIELTEKVAPLEEMPRAVILQLAKDALEVATVVLEKSPVLRDSDLIEIADQEMEAHLVAISKRSKLRARVTSQLLKSKEVDVLRTLAGNSGARFSEKGFRVLAQKAKSDTVMLDKLVDRDDLTPAVTVQIAPFMSEDMKARRGMDAQDAGMSLFDSLDELAVETEQAKKQDSKALSVDTLLEKIIDGSANASEVVIDLADKGDLADLVHLLSALAELPEKSMRAMLLSINGGPISMVCKALQLEHAAFEAVSYLRCEAMNMPNSELIIQADGYDDLKTEEAHKTLTAMRARAAR